MRMLLAFFGVVALVIFLSIVLPSWPWFRRQHSDTSYRPKHTIDPSDPPPPIPEPADDLGPGDRDVPPGSRRDRQRHGKS